PRVSRRGQDEDSLRIAHLFRFNLRPMFLEHAVLDPAVALEHRQSDVQIPQRPCAIVKVSRQCDSKRHTLPLKTKYAARASLLVRRKTRLTSESSGRRPNRCRSG